jgi:phosphoribosylformylglycinamidine synthase
MKICKGYNVEATVLGEFTGDKRFSATYDGLTVMDLEMEFLHDGLPQRFMTAAWRRPEYPEPTLQETKDWGGLFTRVLGHLNVCSKEPIIRLYDHGVQGTNTMPPFAGVHEDGPNNTAILTPLFGKPYGMVISHGLNPVLNTIDPYHGSLWAAAEAVSNAVSAGANPREMVLIDNFIWPFPDEDALGALDMSVDACVDFVNATGMPFISGKDSLSSTYRGKDGTVIKIPPVLCVSVFGRIPDVARTVSADFKKTGSQIVLVGYRNTSEMAGSVYYDLQGAIGQSLPKLDPGNLMKVFEAVYAAIDSDKLLACHDISEGGLGAALAEMCFGGAAGVSLTIPKGESPEYFLFNETAGCFLAELPADVNPAEVFRGVPCSIIGKTTVGNLLTAEQDGNTLFTLNLDELKDAWQQPMKEVFH